MMVTHLSKQKIYMIEKNCFSQINSSSLKIKHLSTQIAVCESREVKRGIGKLTKIN